MTVDTKQVLSDKHAVWLKNWAHLNIYQSCVLQLTEKTFISSKRSWRLIAEDSFSVSKEPHPAPDLPEQRPWFMVTQTTVKKGQLNNWRGGRLTLQRHASALLCLKGKTLGKKRSIINPPFWGASIARYYGVDMDCPSLDNELARCEKNNASKTDEDNEKQVSFGNIRSFLEWTETKGVGWMFNPCFSADDKMRVVRKAAWLGVMVKVRYPCQCTEHWPLAIWYIGLKALSFPDLEWHAHTPAQLNLRSELPVPFHTHFGDLWCVILEHEE